VNCLPNTEELKAIMAERQLPIAAVAQMLDRQPKTVRMWRSQHGPSIPDSMLCLLKLKLQLLDQEKLTPGSDA
jgi:hypothetical protein